MQRCSSILLALLLVLAVGLTACHGKKVQIAKNGEVYYNKPVTQVQARRVGYFFLQSGLFDDGKRKSLKLTREGELYQLRFVVPKDKLTAPGAVDSFRLMTGLVSHQVLGGAKVEVHLADKHFKTWKTVPVAAWIGDLGKRHGFGQGELYAKPPVSDEVARKVGQGLRTRKVFTDERRVTAALELKDGVHHLRFIADTNNPMTRTFFMGVGNWLAVHALGGKALQVHLCDSLFKPVVDLPLARPGARLAVGKGAVYYLEPVSEAEARQAGQELLAAGFFTANQSVQLGKQGDRYQLRFVIKPEALTEPNRRALGKLVSALTWVKAGQVDIFTTDGNFGSPLPFEIPR